MIILLQDNISARPYIFRMTKRKVNPTMSIVFIWHKNAVGFFMGLKFLKKEEDSSTFGSFSTKPLGKEVSFNNISVMDYAVEREVKHSNANSYDLLMFLLKILQLESLFAIRKKK